MSIKIEVSEQSYPLHWPLGQERTIRPTQSKFRTTFSSARSRLTNELKLLKAKAVIISTNIPLKNDGLPYASYKLDDSGVAVYFTYKDKAMVFACDRWKSPQDNIYAIALTIGALRGIDRWGSGDMLERSFMGFQALPAPDSSSPSETVYFTLPPVKKWYEIMELTQDVIHSLLRGPKKSPEALIRILKNKKIELSKKYHPDINPHVDSDVLGRINQACEEGLRECQRAQG